jgi:c-di-AMP phosphodiesterase-like protein
VLEFVAGQYLDVMRWIIVWLATILAVFALYKAWTKRDATLVVVAISRCVVAMLYCWLLFSPTIFVHYEERVLLKDSAFIMIFIVDIISNMVYFASRKYQKEIDINKLHETLTKLEIKNQFILESCPVAIYQYSIATFKYIYVNPEFARIMMKDRKDILYKPVFENMPAEEVARAKASAIARLEGKEAEIRKHRLHVTTSTGEILAFDCESKIVYNGEASILGYARLVE